MDALWFVAALPVSTGLAQITVRPVRSAGEIKLTAASAGHPSVTTSVQTQPRPSFP
jgi:hypothetical protein